MREENAWTLTEMHTTNHVAIAHNQSLKRVQHIQPLTIKLYVIVTEIF